MTRQITTEDFIKRAKKIHGDKYDYSKVEYVKTTTPVCIVCPEHGEFWQKPINHLQNKGCRKCSLTHLSNTNEFILKAKKIHGDKYDYSKVEYVNNSTKVCIICPEHGEFWQRPNSHLSGNGCPKCGGKFEITTEDFIKRAKKIHGDKYDYSKVEYVNSETKVCIICPEHGEFWQTPGSHLKGRGCNLCIRCVDTKTFIDKARKKHGNEYDYSETEYIDSKTPIKIICKKHGIFLTTPNQHLDGVGCPKCYKKEKYTNEKFIEKAKKIHGDKYDYSKVEYVNFTTPVCIVCPEHGEFWQKPNSHLSGNGCSDCVNKNEAKFHAMLVKALPNIEIIHGFRCKWLNRQHLDFYLPEYKIAIEYQGEQHFYPMRYFGGAQGFKYRNELDKRKKDKCEKNGVKIYYFSFKTNIEEFLGEKIYTDINELLKEIFYV